MKSSENKNKTQKAQKAAIWYVIAALLFIYAVFLILKINGIGDYTSKYGIEMIADGEGYNSVMMIDGDVETTWGLLENFEPGSNVYIKFKAPRSISEIRILNVSETPTAEMGIYMSDDGEKFAPCPYTRSEEGQRMIYRLNQPTTGGYLVFTYGNAESGHWPITEVEIYE